MSMPELRVLIVSTNPLARGGLAAMLEGMAGMKAVGSAGVAEAASIAGQLLPDVVLLDVGDGELEALAFGASALLPVAVDPQTLAAALLASARGLVSIPRQEMATLLPHDERIEPAVNAPTESLTPRELEVLQLMARGLTNRQIAGRLQISEHTVKFHAGAVLGKLNARSRAEAVARAIGLGWILV
jgi:DNA-binding NarL/FixJ family response regulator